MSLKATILENYQRTSIELEKKASILYRTCIIFAILLLPFIFVTYFVLDLKPFAALFILCIEVLAFLNCFAVLYSLSLGKYNLASQSFLWCNMVLGYLGTFFIQTGSPSDIFWIVIFTAIFIFIAIMVSVKLNQVIQIFVVGSLAYIVFTFIYILQPGDLNRHSFSYVLMGVIFLIFLGRLGILLFKFSNDSVAMAQKESNMNMIKFSQLKLISAQLSKEFEIILDMIDDFSSSSSKGSSVIASKISALEVALEKIMLEVKYFYDKNPDYTSSGDDKIIYLKEDSEYLLNSIADLNELVSELVSQTGRVEKLNDDCKQCINEFKNDLNQF